MTENKVLPTEVIPYFFSKFGMTSVIYISGINIELPVKIYCITFNTRFVFAGGKFFDIKLIPAYINALNPVLFEI